MVTSDEQHKKILKGYFEYWKRGDLVPHDDPDKLLKTKRKKKI